ncbi:hypothetical protein HZH68_007699 [Vespula germanica]|uniref:C2H2-type domain-containing protein n=1 Tax=Vespula germanica TaxID=30212 RepID=A0A834N7H5_VESGE|nr:hypothetical protein HZH68_007699 [Vespula germanica]
MASSHGSASGNNSASQTADGFSSGRNGERGASGLSIGSMGMTTTTGTTSSAIMTTTTNTTMATSTSSTSSTSTSSSTTSTTGPSPMDTSAGGPAAPSTPITRGSSSSSSSSPASARSAQSNNNNNSHNNNNNSSNNNNNNNSSTPLSTTNSSSSGGQQSGPAIGTMSAPTGRQVPKRRMRRRATSHSQDPAEQLTEMSVRGLNLFRYASISEGVYQCTECAKLDIQKTFKNKYSFQRHAFLYHEGHQRKVFPCPVCSKEFSRPDKMKNHMKTRAAARRGRAGSSRAQSETGSRSATTSNRPSTSETTSISGPGRKRVFDKARDRLKRRLSTTSTSSNQLPILPSDITFEICTSSSSSSSPPPLAATPITTTTTTMTMTTTRSEEENVSESTTGAYIKAERVVSGVHFLTDREEDRAELLLPKSESVDSEPEVRKQLLEYLIQNDGSVVCKWCGEVLPSRTRWYRHKYKLHVSTQVTQPAPLFKCHSCNAYFKSRKGYIGHLSARHSDNENDENREEPSNKKSRKASDIGKGPDWEQQREKEEKLVADIIDRVKRECEAQGETVTRRGYSRRSTVMNS